MSRKWSSWLGGYFKEDPDDIDYEGWNRKEPEVMGVKVEKIEPPRQARFKIYSDSYNYTEFDEKDARAIYEGLAVHFGPKAGGDVWDLIAIGRLNGEVKEKDAEIARLKKIQAELPRIPKVEQALRDEVARLKAAEFSWRQYGQDMRNLREDLEQKEREIAILRADNARITARAQAIKCESPVCCVADGMEVARLRGWLEKIRDAHAKAAGECGSAVRALAGEKVPE